ncbi:MAG TPA: enoyl-CoA hydratase-related protein [Candidatus Eremiobacteraceae bacterium]|nr:enoyl-CoA hydratase-related protein [Candidatus Eremiobacteraceae bacterium]
MSDRIVVNRDGRLGRITLRAGALNVLDTADVRHLEQVICELDDCAVVLLHAESDRAFCAGMEVADHLPDRAPAMLEAVDRLCVAFLAASPVTVAKIGAPAIGGGLELVLLCDLAICSHRAKFSLPEITLAALPPIACGLLAQAIGSRRAADLILTGRTIDAATAELWGIVREAVPAERLDAAASDLCQSLLSLSADALRCCKRAIRAGNVEEAVHIYIQDLVPTPDAAEGINAFLERRKPEFGRVLPAQEVAP